ncbi:MAG: large conductance mechanosensitive channel protein MscL [Acidobacteriota bacterium]
MLKDFRDFITRGNVIDLAIAVVIGAAFGKLISSLVEGVLMPPIGQLLGGVDFSNLFIDLSGERPLSLADAQLRGLPVIAYGQFINDVITFLIIALVVFLIVKAIIRLKRQEVAVLTKDCPYCFSPIRIEAVKCSACCSPLDVVAI